MTDTKISAMPSASVPLNNAAVPCVQDGVNVQAPAAAFGIPLASVGSPGTPLADYQTWIDLSTSPPTVNIAIGGVWKPVYTLDDTGALTLSQPLSLSADPSSAMQAATKQYVDNSTPAGAMLYKGLIDCSTNPNYPAASAGFYYIVSVAGKIGGTAGFVVNPGDGILCKVTNGGGAQGDTGITAAWTTVQGHQSAVIGASSATDSHFVQFSGTDGKTIKDGGLSLDTDATMAANSDTRVPSQKAVKSSLGGKPLSTDTLSQGQGWFWDTISSTFKARSNEGLNLLANSAFELWQENTSYNPLSNTAAKTHIADFWKIGTNTTGRSAQRVTGITGTQYALKVLRAAGNTGTGKIFLAQQFGQLESAYLAGKTVTISFDYATGTTYTPTSLIVALGWGTGIDEDIDLHVSAPLFATGGSGAVSSSLSGQLTSNPVRVIAPPLTFGSNITESIVAIQIGPYVGTALSDDSFTIANVKMEIGNIATPYRKPHAMDELVRAQRRYWKTFLQGTVPTANTGAATGEHRAAATKAGANAQTLGTIRLPTMRAAPTVTLFNPATAASAQARDLTAAADCTATTAQNISDCSIEIAATGNASTAVGNTLGVHVVADARL